MMNPSQGNAGSHAPDNDADGTPRRSVTSIHVSHKDSEHERGVFMISVAAEMAGVHPQTLRIYEVRGLIEPRRSLKGTRLYSRNDVERLRHIQEMTDLGMNLTGVERVFELEAELEQMSERMQMLERRAQRLRQQMDRAVEEVRREFRAEIVRYEPPGTSLVLTRPPSTRVRISRRRPSS